MTSRFNPRKWVGGAIVFCIFVAILTWFFFPADPGVFLWSALVSIVLTCKRTWKVVNVLLVIAAAGLIAYFVSYMWFDPSDPIFTQKVNSTAAMISLAVNFYFRLRRAQEQV